MFQILVILAGIAFAFASGLSVMNTRWVKKAEQEKARFEEDQKKKKQIVEDKGKDQTVEGEKLDADLEVKAKKLETRKEKPNAKSNGGIVVSPDFLRELSRLR